MPTAMGGPQARVTIERHQLTLGSVRQHLASVTVSGLGIYILLFLSVHSFLICWLLEYSDALV